MEKKNTKTETALGGPNDDSSGHCYAPVENGAVNYKKRKHYGVGEGYPPGSKLVPCLPSCGWTISSR